jgi:hypothetical protein
LYITAIEVIGPTHETVAEALRTLFGPAVTRRETSAPAMPVPPVKPDVPAAPFEVVGLADATSHLQALPT